MNYYRSALENQIAMSGHERLVIEGDFNECGAEECEKLLDDLNKLLQKLL